MNFSLFRTGRWLNLAAPLPALIVGALLMHRSGVPPTLWGQSLMAGLLLTIFCAGLAVVPLPSFGRGWPLVVAALAGASLLATFVDAGLEGVHRWVHLGPLRFQAAAICLPLLVIALGADRPAAGSKLTGGLTPWLGAGATALLACQPDAAQATALAGALLVLPGAGPRRTWAAWLAGLVAVACAVRAWQRPDPLLPVPYVEEIVGLAARDGVGWLLAALASLGLLPLPFLLAGCRGGTAACTALALGVYFGLQIVVPRFGFFPVPLLGFGLSPILGYFAALGWLLRARAV